MNRLVPFISLLLFCFVVPAAGAEQLVARVEEPAAQPSADAARAVVERFHKVLIACMQDAEQLGFSGRYDRVAAALDDGFDLPFMARMSVGGAWKDLGPEEREEFEMLSRELSASHYASNFDGYGGQRFETLRVKPAARGTMVVETEVIQPDDRNVRFDYRLRRSGERWRIIDVHLDGRISELTLRRAQFRSLIERDGFPELVESVEEKIAQLSQP